MGRSFLRDSSEVVAPKLLGKIIKREWGKKQLVGLISEVEAYRGEKDPASHAARGLTKRNAVMFGEAGHAYVYLVYGMYYCLNIVTEAKGRPGAVLIRGVYFDLAEPVLGPGRVCKKLRIKSNLSGQDLLSRAGPLTLWDPGINVPASQVFRSPRIGIKEGRDKLWRWEWRPF